MGAATANAVVHLLPGRPRVLSDSVLDSFLTSYLLPACHGHVNFTTAARVGPRVLLLRTSSLLHGDGRSLRGFCTVYRPAVELGRYTRVTSSVARLLS